MIAIVDYGMGNVASVTTTFRKLGYETVITDDKEQLDQASHLILPGVGSFQAAVKEIEERDLKGFLQSQAEKKPFLGICLGMQLLFTEGFEGGRTEGLGLLPGEVNRIETEYLLPHIGWNALEIKTSRESWQEFQDRHVYFVHTYQAYTESEYIVAASEYGTEVPAIVNKEKVYGIQFHPEKSGEVGQRILNAFLKETTQ